MKIEENLVTPLFVTNKKIATYICGFATKAPNRLINYLFEKTNVKILNAVALTRNISSNRVIEKSGFNFISSIEIENEEYHYYQLSKQIF
ncbi:GNAT family N-acetyltransferase [Bacillus sp. DX1.1]|nr:MULTISPECIES: GNAT family N-acetyltransferase [unclassified Bacillus (in: firmicutes)]MDM5154922.1 GNAT family N-acetyltransferase [Bacillus sp. DX1.1]WJE84076.1 GNAT family N-acetyltransferase [Bacillus sp. DX3.1]